MLTLYGDAMSRAHRVMWMLRELGQDFAHIPTDFLRGGNKTPAFLAVNANGKVPVLVHDDVTMCESFAINLYLARVFASPLSARSIAEEAGILQWSFWAVNEVEKTLLITAKNAALFAPEHRRENEVQMGLAKLDRPFRVLDAHLAGRDYLLNSGLSYADFRMAAYLPFNDVAGLPLQDYPAVATWYARLDALPCWADPFAGLDAPKLPPVPGR